MHMIVFSPQIFAGVPLILHPNAHHVGANPVPMDNGCVRVMVTPEPTLEAHALGIALWIPLTDPMPPDAVMLGPASKRHEQTHDGPAQFEDGLIIWRPASGGAAQMDALSTSG